MLTANSDNADINHPMENASLTKIAQIIGIVLDSIVLISAGIRNVQLDTSAGMENAKKNDDLIPIF